MKAFTFSGLSWLAHKARKGDPNRIKFVVGRLCHTNNGGNGGKLTPHTSHLTLHSLNATTASASPSIAFL